MENQKIINEFLNRAGSETKEKILFNIIEGYDSRILNKDYEHANLIEWSRAQYQLAKLITELKPQTTK